MIRKKNSLKPSEKEDIYKALEILLKINNIEGQKIPAKNLDIEKNILKILEKEKILLKCGDSYYIDEMKVKLTLGILKIEGNKFKDPKWLFRFLGISLSPLKLLKKKTDLSPNNKNK